MRKISDSIMNEKLSLNNQSKLDDKPIMKLVKGDKIYLIDLASTNLKIRVCSVYSNGIISFDEKFYGIQYQYSNKEPIGYLINKKSIDDNTKMFSDGHLVISTSKELIEQGLDDNIDSRIQPFQNQINTLQKEINKLQDKINELLKEKENKYINL